MPGGNGILEGKIGNMEYVAPGTIDVNSVRSALFDKRVDLAWTGVVDDTNGSGFLMYYVVRNGTYIGSVRGAFFSRRNARDKLRASNINKYRGFFMKRTHHCGDLDVRLVVHAPLADCEQ